MRKFSSSFFESATKSAAGEGGAIKKVLTSPEFVLPVAAMGLGGVAGLAQSGIRKLLDKRKENKAFQEMLAMHPHLKGRPETARRFKSLARFNPHMANDPSVAGAWLDTVDARSGSYGGADSPSDQGLLNSIGEITGWRNQHTQAVSREREMGKGPDVGRAVGALATHLGATHSKLKNEHGELAVTKEHNQKLQDKVKEMASKDAFQAMTGHAAGPERIRAIENAAVLYQHPGIAPIADILADKRKFEVFGAAMQNIDKPGVLGLIHALNGPAENVHAVREAVQQHGSGGFQHRGGQSRAR